MRRYLRRGKETEMIYLRNFEYCDAKELQTRKYVDKTIDEIKSMIDDMNTKTYHNLYFEMFGIFDDNHLIGMVSLQEHSKTVISCGPEIFEEYRRNGYGYIAVNRALEISKEKGYKIASAQIRTDNIASIALHNKLGFETNGYVYKNRKDREVVICLKALF